MIYFTDIIVFVMLCSITGMAVENFSYVVTGNSGIGFTVMTDGICLLLFLIRIFYGFKYARSVIFPPKMDYSYIVEFGKLKWHTKRVKNMRIYFKNYALASNVSSLFIFIQTLVLWLVLWRDQSMYFRYGFLGVLSLFTVFNLRTVYSHLEELDEQVTFRIRNYSTAVMARKASEKNKEKEPSKDHYKAPLVAQ